MAAQQRLYDIDDLWRIVRDADDDKRFELIVGQLIELPPPGEDVLPGFTLPLAKLFA